MLVGTFPYNGYPSFEEWKRQFDGYCGMGADTGNIYYDHLPVWASGNLYYNGAKPWEKEADAFVDTENNVEVSLKETADGWYLHTNLYDILPEQSVGILSTQSLGIAFEPEQKYENPDGSPITFILDYFGLRRSVTTVAGPFLDKESACKKLF